MAQDLSALQHLRQGKPAAAAAQLAQNVKSKVQQVVADEDPEIAFLLSGIPDPAAQRRFGATPAELAVVSDYITAVDKLEDHQSGFTGEGADGARVRRPTRAQKKTEREKARAGKGDKGEGKGAAPAAPGPN